MKGPRSVLLIVAVALFAACAANSATRSVSHERFVEPDSIILAPGLEPQPASRPLLPRIPASEVARAKRAQIAAAFVLGADGRAEYKTISFIRSNSQPFRESVCEFLSEARFTPFVQDGRTRRGLAIFALDYFVSDTPLPTRPADALTPASFENDFRATPKDSLFRRLSGMPHC